MRPTRFALIPAVLLIVACSTGTGSAGSPGTRLTVRLTDMLRMEPARLSVPRGLAVTFVVTNTGAIDHEFFLGSEAAQEAHESEMVGMPGMSHDSADGFTLKPGETKELVHTFGAAGQTLAGCHETGHYGAGMKATITIEG